MRGVAEDESYRLTFGCEEAIVENEMTEADVKILLAVAAEAAGMIAIAWVYACHRVPAKAPLRAKAVVRETSEES